MFTPLPRLERLRSAFLQRDPEDLPKLWGFFSDEMRYWYAKGWMDAVSEPILVKRQTLARAAMYENLTPIIDPDELIVGKPAYRLKLDEARARFLEQAWPLLPQFSGQDAHMAMDYEKLLTKGTEGVRREVEQYMAKLDVVANPQDIEKRVFYENCLRILQAVERCAEHYALHAEALAKQEPNEVRKQELLQIAQNMRVVPQHPAQTFWQAMQAIHFICVGLNGLYQMGRPDQLLWSYYQADLEKGILTREKARELIGCFCIMYNEYVPKSLAVGMMVGGRAPDGKEVCNELTYLFVESIFDVRLSYPGVGLCVTPNTPDDLLELSCRALAEGYTHPALFNDEVITRGLMSYGLPFEEASQYIHSTCVEVTPIKSSGVWVAMPYYNLMQPLLQLMGMEGDGGASRAQSLDELMAEYKALLLDYMRREVQQQNLLLMNRAKTYSNPLVSCFVDDCLARGRDLDDGGARYAFVYSSFVGMANLADSMIAIDDLVFRNKELTLEQFAQILRENYAGNEALRQRILHKIEKYGNDCERPDSLVKELSEWITEVYTQFSTYKGFQFVPSMFCWIKHELLGSQTPATPDGRVAGFPLGDGSGPAQGREEKGPTASILSSTSWSHERFVGGIAVNMKFSKALFSEQSLAKMVQMVRVFMLRGGFELQINVVDREKLLAAQKDPDSYRDLVVRIGGYSDYFTNLSKAMQDEVLLRTAHEL